MGLLSLDNSQVDRNCDCQASASVVADRQHRRRCGRAYTRAGYRLGAGTCKHRRSGCSLYRGERARPLRVDRSLTLDNQLWDTLPKAVTEHIREERKKLPVGRPASPAEVAESYLFLMKYVLNSVHCY